MAQTEQSGPILVPVDFSPHSEGALAFAMELAAALGAPVTVLHVVHDPGEAPGFYAGKRPADSLARLEDVAAEMLREFMSDFRGRHPEWSEAPLQTMLKVGLPVTRILEVVEHVGARMVIMGSQGRTGLAHVLLGSKAEQVVRLCPVPVTIVKKPDE